MKRYDWYGWTTCDGSGVKQGSPVSKLAIGIAVGLLLFVAHHRTMAVVVWGFMSVITVMAYLWPASSAGLERFLALLGHGLARAVTIAVLTPVFLMIFPLIRVFNLLAHRDPLHLRDRESHTFWLASDNDSRKRKYVSSMFASERAVGGRSGKLAFAVSCVLLIMLAEVLLRFLGVGHPILYVDDPMAGYYPGPNQRVYRYSDKLVATNQFGMRAPSYPEAKPKGCFRILMLGDSTLWGGSYVNQDEIYARLVEKQLNTRGESSRVQVLNMGVNGWGPYHELGYVERFGTFGADAVIVCLPIGDVERPLSRLSQAPYFPVQSPPRLALEEVFLKLIWRYHTRLMGPSSAEAIAIQVEQGMRAYVDLGKRLREAGCEVLFEVLPSRTAGVSTQVPAPEKVLVDRLTEALGREGFRVGFPAGFAAGQPAEALADLYHDECHLHWRGHHLYAEYLTSRISEQSQTFQAWSGSQRAAVVRLGAGL